MAHSEEIAESVKVEGGRTSWGTAPFNGSDQNEGSNPAEWADGPSGRRGMGFGLLQRWRRLIGDGRVLGEDLSGAGQHGF